MKINRGVMLRFFCAYLSKNFVDTGGNIEYKLNHKGYYY